MTTFVLIVTKYYIKLIFDSDKPKELLMKRMCTCLLDCITNNYLMMILQYV